MVQPRSVVDDLGETHDLAKDEANQNDTKTNTKRMSLPNSQSGFGDIRTVDLSPVVQISFEYTVDNSELNDKVETNGGTVTQSDAMAVVNTSTTTGSVASICSVDRAKYKPGMTGLFRGSALFTTGTAGTSQWLGIFDETGSSEDFANGFGIGYNGDTFGVVRFYNDNISFTALSDCDDPLDGTGKSGINLDTTLLNTYQIQYQAGAGDIEFFVEKSSGDMLRFHTIKYPNMFTTPNVYNPNFRLFAYADNKSTTDDLTVKSPALAYFVEGATSEVELDQFHKNSDVITKSGVTTEVALMTIRNKSTYNSKTNFINVLLERYAISYAGSTNTVGEFRLVKNATLGGTPSYSDINTTDSVIEIDTDGTTVTGGTTLIAGSLSGKQDHEFENLFQYRFVLAPGDTITLAIESDASAEFKGNLLWEELF